MRIFMHVFMHLHEQGRGPRGGAGWARNTPSAAPGGARGQAEPVGLVQGARRYQGPPIRRQMHGQPVALCSQREKKALEATVVCRSLAKRETRSLSADVSVRGLFFSN